MPSTITTYHTFQAATKARASQVNANFSNYRGTILPIEENTAAASHLTHNLGASDHRFLTGYFQTVDLRTSTTTAGLTILGDTAATTGSFLFKINNTTTAQILSSGFDGAFMSPGTHTLVCATYTANGTFTVPTGVYSLICWLGGGGGGGGCGQAGASGSGAAGGNGSKPETVMIHVSPGDVLSITVGTGGAGGPAAGNSGSAGTDTTVIEAGVKHARVGGAQGGGGGVTTTAGGAPNSTIYGSNGCFNVTGGTGGLPAADGTAGYDSQHASGGARGTAFSAGEGGSGGGGGAGRLAGGQGGNGGTGGAAAQSGVSGAANGSSGGGGGGGADGASPGAGGNGGSGFCFIYYMK